jgi:hypothetical protein
VRRFTEALLGWSVRPGNGSQVSVQIGDIGGAIIRGNAAARAIARGDAAAAAAIAKPASGVTAAIGHISFGIANWNTERVARSSRSATFAIRRRRARASRGPT